MCLVQICISLNIFDLQLVKSVDRGELTEVNEAPLQDVEDEVAEVHCSWVPV